MRNEVYFACKQCAGTALFLEIWVGGDDVDGLGAIMRGILNTALKLLVARPGSASAEFPSVPSILRPMAVMAVMGRFCMQSCAGVWHSFG